MNKYIFVVLAFIFVLATQINAQSSTFIKKKEIVGLWQIHDPGVGAGLGDHYRFYSNGEYRFEVSGDYVSHLSRLLCVKGSYKILDSTVVFYLKSYTEKVGGELGLSDFEGFWEFQNDTLKTTVLEHAKEIPIPVYPIKRNRVGKIEYWYINSRPFFKLNNDPDALTE